MKKDINPADLNTFNRFNSVPGDNALDGDQATSESREGNNLADIIVQKIAAWEADHTNGRETIIDGQRDQNDDLIEVPPKVAEVYSK